MDKKETLGKDIIALQLLKSFLPKKSYIPYSSSSLSFETIRIIVNDIAVNKRTSLVEFGSGISTIILGAAVENLSNNGSLISIDEDEQWSEIIQDIINKEQINNVEIIHQSLDEQHKSKSYGWYNATELAQKINRTADLFIIDGPSAWQNGRSEMRRYALEFIMDNKILNEDSFAIYLDDCNRPGEKKILEEWGKKLNCQPQIINSNLGRISRKNSFNVV